MLLAAVALTGCKREEHPARQRIAIATTIEPLTRAPQLDDEGSGRFADTDRLTLLVSDDAAYKKTYNLLLLIENKEFTRFIF